METRRQTNILRHIATLSSPPLRTRAVLHARARRMRGVADLQQSRWVSRPSAAPGQWWRAGARRATETRQPRQEMGRGAALWHYEASRGEGGRGEKGRWRVSSCNHITIKKLLMHGYNASLACTQAAGFQGRFLSLLGSPRLISAADPA